MRRTTARLALALATTAAVALAAAACEPFPPEGELDASGRCIEEHTVLDDIKETSELGFAPAELLALAEGEHSGAMLWGPGLTGDLATVKFGPDSGTSGVTAIVKYAGGEVRHVRSTAVADGEPGACGDHIEVDVEVTLQTVGGVLNEKFVAAVRGSSPKVALIRHAIAFEELQGTLSLETVEPAAAEVGPLQLEIGVSQAGLFGGATATVEVREGDSVAAAQVDVARWPGDSTCAAGEVPLPAFIPLAGFSAVSALEYVNGARPMQISWEGLGTGSLALEVSHDGGTVCGTFEGEAFGALRIGAVLEVYTGDERWMGTFPVELVAHPRDDGSLERVELAMPADQAMGVPASEFAAFYGIDIDHLESYEVGILDLRGAFTQGSGGARADGTVTVFGATTKLCTEFDPKPCAGPTQTPLATAVWGRAD